MSNPTTPGVSVEEITRLPYSVSFIDTAMPAFIGYTERIPEGYSINADKNEKLIIRSLLEYEAQFGKAKEESIHLKDVAGKGMTLVAPKAKFLMYYSLQMYFANGGGPCYIISVGNYTSAKVELSSLKNGLDRIKSFQAIQDPLLIVFPDAVSLPETDFYTLYNETTEEIKTQEKNWFAILDTYDGNSVTSSNNPGTIGRFRTGVNPTSHAAAYFPHLKTILNYTFDETKTAITHEGLQQSGQDSSTFYEGEITALTNLQTSASDEISGGSANAYILADLLAQAIAIAEEIYETADETSGETIDGKGDLKIAIHEAKEVVEAIYEGIIDDFAIPDGFEKETPIFRGEFQDLIDAIRTVKDEKGDADGMILQNLESSNSSLYNQIKEVIKTSSVVLPPSSTIAGVYGRIDSTRGVWKAPANVSLNYVVAPTEKVSEQEQSTLNIDVDGKSINAIRTFAGKGTLVWGARTFQAKNKENKEDNEWKYIQVRRYYDMLEQSISEAIGRFINQPNIPYTWLRVKTMLENFLNQQWIDGALAGSIPQEAYHVEISGDKNKPKTMNVTIKVALVRPAEFIMLNFSHKLQQS